MFFLFKNDKVNVPNLSIHIELLGCTDAQLFCDFCNEHIYTQSTEYNNIHLQPCHVFITLFKKAKYVKSKVYFRENGEAENHYIFFYRKFTFLVLL